MDYVLNTSPELSPEINTRAHGKLILFGEHAAVFGHDAVGTQVRDEIALAWMPQCGARALSQCPPWYRPSLSEILKRLAKLVPGASFSNGTLISAGSLSSAGGFGSSAALSVGLYRLAMAMSGEPAPGLDQTWLAAHELEKVIHRSPSGIDTGLACYPGLSWFTREESRELPGRRPVPAAGFSLVYGAVQRDGNTMKLVQGIRERVQCGDQTCIANLARLGQIATDFAQGCGQGLSAVSFGNMATEAQTLLTAMNLDHPVQNAVFAEARRHGALGAKLSGAGSGGAFFLVARDQGHAQELSRVLNTFARDEHLDLASSLGLQYI